MLTGIISLTQPLEELNRNITIQGPGATGIVVERSAMAAIPFAIFMINANKTCTISGLTVTNGDAGLLPGGGGVYNLGTLTLEDCELTDNVATSGGAIYKAENATLHVSKCDVYWNTASISGGGIFNAGALDIAESQIYSNSARFGGGTNNNTSSANLATCSCEIYGNYASSDGGGIYNKGGLTMCQSSLHVNSADMNGGGIYCSGGTANLDGTSITNNSAQTGGGFYVDSGPLSLSNLTISGNTAATGSGGAYTAGGSYSVFNCQVLDEIVQV